MDQKGQSSLGPAIFFGIAGLLILIGLMSFMAKSADLPVTASLKDGTVLGVHIQVNMPLSEFMSGSDGWPTAVERAVVDTAKSLTKDEASKDRERVSRILGEAAAKALERSGSHGKVDGVTYAVGVTADQMVPHAFFIPVIVTVPLK